MPPYKSNPIRRAASEFYDEPMDPEFFVPVGRGNTAFGRYISPSLAAADRLMMDDLNEKRDDQQTKAVENFTRRLEAGSRNRILPHSEQAKIAQHKLDREKAQSGSRLNPFAEDAGREKLLLDKEISQAGRQTLPDDIAAQNLERDYKSEKLRFADPMQERLAKVTDNPAHLLAYEHFRDSAPETIADPSERGRFAYAKSLQLARDADAVAALWDAYSDGELDDVAIGELTESVDDASGNNYGMMVRNTPEARARVNSILAQQRGRKLKLQEQRESRISNASRDAQILRSLDDEISDLREQSRLDGGNADIKKALEEARIRRRAIIKRLEGDDMPASPAPSAAKPVDKKETDRLLR